MRLALLLCLPLASYACYAAEQLENVQAIQGVLKERDASLDWYILALTSSTREQGRLRYTGGRQLQRRPAPLQHEDRLGQEMVGDALYCGISHGLYIVRDDKLTQLRFEPDAQGKLVMVEKPLFGHE